MKKVTQKKLDKIIKEHHKWLKGEMGGKREDLSGVNLSFTNLSGAKNTPYIPMACPEEGQFIGWKKVRNFIIKLQIPAKAKRSSATGRKCRCEFAKVLSIENLDGTKATVQEITSNLHNLQTVYKVGEMVYPDKWDDNRWNECSNGIHFFVNRQEAVDY